MAWSTSYDEIATPLDFLRFLSLAKMHAFAVTGPICGDDPGDGIAMPIRPELRPLYPPHWRELSSHVRFECAEGRCQRCGRPHLVVLRCLPDGRWFDEQAATWRDRRGRPARWPDLMETPRFRMTRVVLAAAHLDSDPIVRAVRKPTDF